MRIISGACLGAVLTSSSVGVLPLVPSGLLPVLLVLFTFRRRLLAVFCPQPCDGRTQGPDPKGAARVLWTWSPRPSRPVWHSIPRWATRSTPWMAARRRDQGGALRDSSRPLPRRRARRRRRANESPALRNALRVMNSGREARREYLEDAQRLRGRRPPPAADAGRGDGRKAAGKDGLPDGLLHDSGDRHRDLRRRRRQLFRQRPDDRRRCSRRLLRLRSRLSRRSSSRASAPASRPRRTARSRANRRTSRYRWQPLLLGGCSGDAWARRPCSSASRRSSIFALVACWCSDALCGVSPDASPLAPLAALLLFAIAQRDWEVVDLGMSSFSCRLPSPRIFSRGYGMGWGDAKLVALTGAVLGAPLAVASRCAVACARGGRRATGCRRRGARSLLRHTSRRLPASRCRSDSRTEPRKARPSLLGRLLLHFRPAAFRRATATSTGSAGSARSSCKPTGCPTVLGNETFTAAGAPWVPQEWLFSVIVSIATNLRLFLLLALLMSAIPLAVLLLVYLRARREAGPTAIGVALVFCGMTLTESFGVRAQVVGYGFFALFVFLLERKDRWYWATIPVAIAWANVHASVAIAPFVLGARLVATLSEGGVQRLRGNRDLALLPALLLATVCTPLGLRLPALRDKPRGQPDTPLHYRVAASRGSGFLFSLPGTPAGTGHRRRRSSRALRTGGNRVSPRRCCSLRRFSPSAICPSLPLRQPLSALSR